MDVNSLATREAILGAIDQMGDETTLPELVGRFVQKADKPLAEPIAADDEVTPIRTCAEMAATSREFGNCLGLHQKLTGALHGRMAYAIFRDEVVMEFGGLSDGSWVYMGCHGKENGLVEPHLSRAAEAKCDASWHSARQAQPSRPLAPSGVCWPTTTCSCSIWRLKVRQGG